MLDLIDIQDKASKFLKTFVDIHEKEKKKEEKRVKEKQLKINKI